MSIGEWIGIHDKGGDILSVPGIFYIIIRRWSVFSTAILELFQIIRKSSPPVFHKHKLIRHPCNLREPKIPEEFRSIAFRIKKQMRIPAFKLNLDQMSDNLIHKPLTLM